MTETSGGRLSRVAPVLVVAAVLSPLVGCAVVDDSEGPLASGPGACRTEAATTPARTGLLTAADVFPGRGGVRSSVGVQTVTGPGCGNGGGMPSQCAVGFPWYPPEMLATELGAAGVREVRTVTLDSGDAEVRETLLLFRPDALGGIETLLRVSRGCVARPSRSHAGTSGSGEPSSTPAAARRFWVASAAGDTGVVALDGALLGLTLADEVPPERRAALLDHAEREALAALTR